MDTLDRKTFFRRGLVAGTGLEALGPLHALGAEVAYGSPTRAPGYGPLVDKGDLWLPQDFDYAVIQRQGETMSDGNLVPGIFDGMGAFPGKRGTIVLIRNHENRRQAGEIPVIVPEALRYDPTPSWAARTRTAPAARRRGIRGSPARRSSTAAPRASSTATSSTSRPMRPARSRQSRSSAPAGSCTRHPSSPAASSTRPRTVRGRRATRPDRPRETVTLVCESPGSSVLQAPDNVVVVPKTGHILLQEDGSGEQFVRGVTRQGQIYDFAKTAANDTEFCGGCFDSHGQILFVNQQGERGNLPGGPPGLGGVTYAIWGPWKKVD